MWGTPHRPSISILKSPWQPLLGVGGSLHSVSEFTEVPRMCDSSKKPPRFIPESSRTHWGMTRAVRWEPWETVRLSSKPTTPWAPLSPSLPLTPQYLQLERQLVYQKEH